jgi:cytochrome c551/c552
VHGIDANILFRQRGCVVTHQSDDAVFGGVIAGIAMTSDADLGHTLFNPATELVMTIAPPSPCSNIAGSAASTVCTRHR